MTTKALKKWDQKIAAIKQSQPDPFAQLRAAKQTVEEDMCRTLLRWAWFNALCDDEGNGVESLSRAERVELFKVWNQGAESTQQSLDLNDVCNELRRLG
jgi:hypothetical protein